MIKLRKILLYDFLYFFLLFLVVCYTFLIVNIKKESKYDINDNRFKVIVKEIKIDGNKLSIEVYGKEKLIGTYYFKTKEEKDEFLKYKIGDTLIIKGALEEPKSNTIPNMFNYKKYLYNHSVFYLLKINDYKKIKSNTNVIYSIKNNIVNRINKFKYKEYFYTFITGETYYIDNNTMNNYRYNGITHLFALSGMHVGVISLIIIKVLKLFKIGEFKRYLITFIFLILLMFLASFSPSIVRASVFFFLLGINQVYYFNIKTINVFYLTLVILLFINPFYIYDLGFQLSFVVTFFLIISSKLLSNKSKFKSLFIISLVSFLSSLPIIINNFYYVNLFGIINNLIFVPFVSIIVFPLTLITFIFPITEPILNILYIILEWLNNICSNVTFFQYTSAKFNKYFIVLYYLFLILFLTNKKGKYLFFIIVIIILNYNLPKFDNNTYVYFVDVGQGNSALIITPHLKHVVIVDVGGKLAYKEEKWQEKNKKYTIGDTLIPFYRSLGIKKIDYMFLTHGDEDHSGEANKIIENFKISNVYINKGEVNKLERSIKKKKIINKEEYYLDNIKISLLSKMNYNEENDNSMVLLFEINKRKILIMGDAPVKVEEDIIPNKRIKNIDILAVGHHGSITSSSEEFINYTNPKYSVISVGKNNRFGHPRSEVINRLSNTNIIRTDEEGSIVFIIKKNTFKRKVVCKHM